MTGQITPAGFEPYPQLSPHTVQFGPIFVNRSDGRLAFLVDEQHTNNVGMCHGGALATFADMQISSVNVSGVRGGDFNHTPTINLSIDYIGATKLGDWVELQGMLLRETKSLVFTQALLTVDSKVIVRTSAVYRVFRPKE